MINFNSKNVNEQILCLADQFNSENPEKQLNVEQIKTSYNYGEHFECNALGILYNEDLEELMKSMGYSIIENKKYNHSVEIILTSINEESIYSGFGFMIPDRYNMHEKSELFIDFNTFK